MSSGEWLYVVVAVILFLRLGTLSLVPMTMLPVRLHEGAYFAYPFELAVVPILLNEVVWHIRSGRPLRRDALQITGIAFISLSGLSGFWTEDLDETIRRVGILSEAACGFLALRLFADRRVEGVGLIARTIGLTGAVSAAWALVWWIVLDKRDSLNLQVPESAASRVSLEARLGSPLLGASNYFAAFLVMTIPLAWVCCRNPVMRRVVLSVQLLALILTVSRGSITALLVGACLVAILLAVRGVIGPRAVVLACLGAAISLLALPRLWSALLVRRGAVSSSDGGEVRTTLFKAALNEWGTHPVGGAGAGTFEHRLSAVEVANAHNSFLQILAELGTLGLVVSAAAVLAVAYLASTISPPLLRYGVVGGVAAGVLSSLIEANFEGVAFTWFVGCYFALVSAAALTRSPLPHALSDQASERETTITFGGEGAESAAQSRGSQAARRSRHLGSHKPECS